MVVRCLSVSGCISVSARRFCTGIKNHPMDTGPVWETLFMKHLGCANVVWLVFQRKKIKGEKVNSDCINDQQMHIKYLLIVYKYTQPNLSKLIDIN